MAINGLVKANVAAAYGKWRPGPWHRTCTLSRQMIDLIPLKMKPICLYFYYCCVHFSFGHYVEKVPLRPLRCRARSVIHSSSARTSVTPFLCGSVGLLSDGITYQQQQQTVHSQLRRGSIALTHCNTSRRIGLQGYGNDPSSPPPSYYIIYTIGWIFDENVLEVANARIKISVHLPGIYR